MADLISKEKRSANMRAIRSVSMLEHEVSRALWARGLRFRKNVKGLPGKPDIAIKKYKIVIFIDSCYWHGCPDHGITPKTNIDFWTKKLNRNKERDKEINKYYQKLRWILLRVWEHEVKRDFEGTINKIIEFINHSK